MGLNLLEMGQRRRQGKVCFRKWQDDGMWTERKGVVRRPDGQNEGHGWGLLMKGLQQLEQVRGVRRFKNECLQQISEVMTGPG